MAQPANRPPATKQRSRTRGQESVPFSAEALKGVTAVVIDLGDTLIPLSRARTMATKVYYEGLTRETGLDRVTVADGLRQLRNQELLTLPFGLNSHGPLAQAFPDEDLVQKFAPLGLQMRRTFGDLAVVDRNTVTFLERLKDQGHKVVLMTALPESAARFALRESGLANLVHHSYPAQDIEQEAPGGANSRRLNDVLGGGVEVPMTPIPAGLNAKEQLQFVMTSEGLSPKPTLRVADHIRRDLGPAKSVGLRTAHMIAHSAKTDPDLARDMERLRRGSGQVEPPQILPVTPRYEPKAAHVVADYVVQRTEQLAASVEPVKAEKPIAAADASLTKIPASAGMTPAPDVSFRT
ncbi:MAG: hypothetical protein AAF556_00425 [Pseudomonadota bacterium]